MTENSKPIVSRLHPTTSLSENSESNETSVPAEASEKTVSVCLSLKCRAPVSPHAR